VPLWLRWAATLAVLALALGGMGASVALHDSSTTHPGPFYAVPSPLPHGPPGTLIREEPIPGLYQGAKAYRVLYKSISFDGRLRAVSGVVVVPEGRAPGHGRKVIAFTHGTVGVASGCAPSLHPGDATQVIEGLGSFIAAGYVVTATDYAGLGTPGPHPYLVGRVEAMNALDSVRAAHRLHQAHAGVEFAVWGHSQGGQASLFTGQLAPSYAPELRLVGVAAGAPVPDPAELLKVNVKTAVGRALIAMALSSWSRVYAGARLQQILVPAAIPTVAQIAGYCLYGNQALATLSGGAALGIAFFRHPPWRVQPWRTILAQNTPGATPIHVPVLMTQGGADTIVPARVTERLARRLCAEGEQVDLHLYPSVGHLEAGIVVVPDVAAWIADRFAGRTPPSTCGR
jgi:pimeloyl-ACP methyl ester carboxylesterase